MKNESTSKVTTFPAGLLTGALVLTGVVLMALVWFTFDSYRNATAGQRRNLRIEELRGSIVHLDEVLTMSARMAAAAGGTDWERRYRQFEPQLDAAIKEAMQLTAHSASAEAAAQTDAANLALVEMEDRSFALVRAGKAGEARAVLFADAYEAQKQIYARGMATLLRHLNEQMTENQRRGQREAVFSIVAVALCIILLFLTWLSILAKLKRVHRQLLETSRQAGMAEAATGVLHNVGNVLNSVNVSATVVADKVKKSRSASLAKVVALLREHEADLGAFLTADPKGKQVPAFLGALAEHLGTEQTELLQEITSLRKNIQHIKDVVGMQQTYAKVSGVTETLDVGELLEDTLRMSASSLQRHDVEVVREFAEVPPVTVDKHKLLQILVNLVRNAKQACDESGRTDKKLTLRVAAAAGHVRISVTDNGVGIPAENLNRIFNHGFTTKKDGHGFGLHSAANAAKEMGGRLSVHSDGPGLGTTFTIELPVRPASGRLAAPAPELIRLAS